ncbi:MAG: hypothetical protein IME93_03070 [Proteobacteria bacterium]|nr:hypothetical protein [Pseudomonadota bacterium]
MKRKQGSPSFERWYKVYPVKKAPMMAMKSWERDGMDDDVEELITHTKIMKATDKAWKQGYAPYPATYLNQQRYFDEPDIEQQQTKLPPDNQLEQWAKENGKRGPKVGEQQYEYRRYLEGTRTY